MTLHNKTAVAALLSLFVLGACAKDSHVTDHWGEAAKQNMEQMVADPQAPAQTDQAPQGVDPQTAEGTIENYGKAREYENQIRRQRLQRTGGIFQQR